MGKKPIQAYVRSDAFIEKCLELSGISEEVKESFRDLVLKRTKSSREAGERRMIEYFIREKLDTKAKIDKFLDNATQRQIRALVLSSYASTATDWLPLKHPLMMDSLPNVFAAMMLGRKSAILNRLLKRKVKLRVLDIGCASGKTTAQIALMLWDVVGNDFEMYAIDQDRHELPKTRKTYKQVQRDVAELGIDLPDKLHLATAHTISLPFESSSVDIVTFLATSSYTDFAGVENETADEIYRILKLLGFCVVGPFFVGPEKQKIKEVFSDFELWHTFKADREFGDKNLEEHYYVFMKIGGLRSSLARWVRSFSR